MVQATRVLTLLALLLGLASLFIHLSFPTVPTEEPQGNSGAPQAQDQQTDDAPRLDWLLERASRAPRIRASAVAAFPKPAPEPVREATPIFPQLFPPQELRAVAAAGGIQLSWKPHPENPSEGRRFRLSRWSGLGEVQVLAETEALEWLDPVECEGKPYHYRVQAILEREILGGQTATRDSPSAKATGELPPSTVWQAQGVDANGKLILLGVREARPSLGPYRVATGDLLGDSGWFLEELRVRETEVRVQTRTPRFDALGRRVIISGQPADRVREELEPRQLATVQLTDPCGFNWSLELLLPKDS